MVARPSLLYNADNTQLSLSSRIAFSTSRPARAYAVEEGDGPPYVTDILSYANVYVAVNTENTIKYLDKETLKTLHEIQSPAASTVRSIAKMHGNIGEEGLIVTYEDGTVGVFDVRDPSPAPRLSLKGPQPAPCICASSSKSNVYIASGTELYHHEATIRIHDIRQAGKLLHVYADTHSDDVSTLAFHPEEEHLLLSGAMDGLISTIDVRIEDEDDAILHTANVGASLSKVGWMPLPGKAGPWTGAFGLTNMETLSIYDASDELSVVKEYGDVRDIENSQWQTHYVIDCQGLPGGLALTAGTREGALAIMQVPLEKDWTLEQVLQGGHSDIVRSCRLDLQSGSAVTCGEDGQVCLWSAAAAPAANGVANGTARDLPQSGGPLKV